jgi:hypothetical protein
MIMKCPNCGTPLEDDAVFCVTCGTKIQQDEELQSEQVIDHATEGPDESKTEPVDSAMPEQKAADATSLNRIDFEHFQILGYGWQNIVAFCVGSIIILIGFARILSAGTSVSATSFGGDFYTYAYQGIVAITVMLSSIEVSLGWIIVAIGAAIDIRALRK